MTPPSAPLAGWLTRLRAQLPALAGVGRRARIVEALPLGPGSRLLVVEFGGRELLIGQARGQLTCLADAGAGPAPAGPLP